MGSISTGDVLSGRYRVERKLGEGGMGAVYLARRVDDGALVVVKTLLASWAKDARSRKRFAVEAEAAARLEHPNIVRILDFDADATTPILVMEYLEGQTLVGVIREGPMMAVARAASLTQQVAAALAFAHGQGIVHRDIKPANVMVVEEADGSERVKLLDFGLARILDEERRTRLTRTGEVLGTPGYLAPEQALGEEIGPHTDIWAVGVMLYVMLTRHLPFPGGDTGERLIAMLTASPVPISHDRPDVPDAIAAVIFGCLEKQPADRPRSAAELEQALDLALSGHARVPAVTQVDGLAAAPAAVASPPSVGMPPTAVAADAASPPDPTRIQSSEQVAGSAIAPPARKRGRGLRWGLASLAVVGLLAAAAIVVLVALAAEPHEPPTTVVGAGPVAVAPAQAVMPAATAPTTPVLIPPSVMPSAAPGTSLDEPGAEPSAEPATELDAAPTAERRARPAASSQPSAVEGAARVNAGAAGSAAATRSEDERPSVIPARTDHEASRPTAMTSGRTEADLPTDIEIPSHFQNAPAQLHRTGSITRRRDISSRDARSWIDSNLRSLRGCFSNVVEPGDTQYGVGVEFDERGRLDDMDVHPSPGPDVELCMSRLLRRAEGPPGVSFRFRLRWR